MSLAACCGAGQRDAEAAVEDLEAGPAGEAPPPEEAAGQGAAAPPAGGAPAAAGATAEPPAQLEPLATPASDGAAADGAAEPTDPEAAPVPAPAARGKRRGFSLEQEALRKQQRHPHAALNVVSTLEPTTTLCGLACKILGLAVALVLLLPLVLLKAVLVLALLPLWCLCPECLLGCAGEEEQHNFEPRYMLPSSTSVPAQLSGVFYMRNNPMDDDLVCMERGTWDDAGKVLHLPVYIARTWSFKKKFISFAMLVSVKLLRYRYRFDFKTEASGKLTEATCRLQLFCLTVPTSLLHFGMTDVSEARDGSLWERWTLLLGMPIFSYWLERIMDSQGNQTKYWEHVQNEVPDQCICISG